MKNTINEIREEKESVLPDSSQVNQTDEQVFKMPETPQKPDHTKATAQIFVDGLSILKFNEAEKCVEIGFVKEHHSPVEVVVYKDCKPLYPYSGAGNKPVTIEIRKTNPKSIGECYKDAKKDEEDFAWMPDLCQWYSAAKIDVNKAVAQHHLSAKLVLRDAVFYTKIKSVSEAVRTDLDTGEADVENIGRVLGADITCEDDDSELIVSITGEPDQRFSKNDGPFLITVRTYPHDHSSSHFGLLYDYIIALPRGGHKYELKYKHPESFWDPCRTKHIESTEYACQSYGGGSGDLPVIPPPDPLTNQRKR